MTRIAALGGPYANPYALPAVLDDARERRCERIFCLGDHGGFRAGCDAIWPLLLEHEVECIAGNYDVAMGHGDPDWRCGRGRVAPTCCCAPTRGFLGSDRSTGGSWSTSGRSAVRPMTGGPTLGTPCSTWPTARLRLRQADGSLPAAFRCAV